MVALPPRGEATRLVFVRHGEAGADGRLCGRLDVPLSAVGRRQAKVIASALAPLRLAAVYSSPLRRALDTASPLAAAQGLQPRTDARLQEIDFGELDGRPYADIELEEPQLARAWLERPSSVRFPGGETFPEFRRRVLAAVDEIRLRHPGQALALVAHGGVIRVAIASALGMPPDELFRLDQAYGAISVVDWYGEITLVRVVNATAGSNALLSRTGGGRA